MLYQNQAHTPSGKPPECYMIANDQNRSTIPNSPSIHAFDDLVYMNQPINHLFTSTQKPGSFILTEITGHLENEIPFYL